MKTDHQLDKAFYITGWILLGVLAVFTAAAHLLHRDLLHSVPPCAVHTFTGYYCPGCGATRAVISITQGRLLRSLFYHPFILYAAVAGGWFMLSQTAERMSRHRLEVGMRFRYIYVWIGLALILGNMLIKNAVLYFAGVALME